MNKRIVCLICFFILALLMFCACSTVGGISDEKGPSIVVYEGDSTAEYENYRTVFSHNQLVNHVMSARNTDRKSVLDFESITEYCILGDSSFDFEEVAVEKDNITSLYVFRNCGFFGNRTYFLNISMKRSESSIEDLRAENKLGESVKYNGQVFYESAEENDDKLVFYTELNGKVITVKTDEGLYDEKGPEYLLNLKMVEIRQY